MRRAQLAVCSENPSRHTARRERQQGQAPPVTGPVPSPSAPEQPLSQPGLANNHRHWPRQGHLRSTPGVGSEGIQCRRASPSLKPSSIGAVSRDSWMLSGLPISPGHPVLHLEVVRWYSSEALLCWSPPGQTLFPSSRPNLISVRGSSQSRKIVATVSGPASEPHAAESSRDQSPKLFNST
jgi:hypothetical protein